jgi:hypothetical protein
VTKEVKRFSGTVAALFLMYAGGSFLAEPLPLLFVVSAIIPFVASLTARTRPVLQGVLPVVLSAGALLAGYFAVSSDLYPTILALVSSTVSLATVCILALIGTYAALPFRGFVHRPPKDPPPDPMAERRDRYDILLRRTAVFTLALFLHMHVLVPFAGGVFAADSMKVDEFIENFDPDKEYHALPRTTVTPPQQRMPKEVGFSGASEEQSGSGTSSEGSGSGNNTGAGPGKNTGASPGTTASDSGTETTTLSPEEQRLEELKQRALPIEDLITLYEADDISGYELTILLLNGVKQGSISGWDLARNSLKLGGLLAGAVGPIAGALLAVLANPQDLRAWNSLIDKLDAEYGGVFHTIKNGKDHAVQKGNDALRYAWEHPRETAIALGLGLALGAAVVFGSPLIAGAAAVTLATIGVVSLATTGHALWEGYRNEGLEGVAKVIFDEDTIAVYTEEGFWAAAGMGLVDIGVFVLMNFPEFPTAALVKVPGAVAKVLTAFNKIDDIGDALAILKNARVALDMALAAGKLSAEAAALSKLLLREAAGTLGAELDLMAGFILYGDEYVLNKAYLDIAKRVDDAAALGVEAQKQAVRDAYGELMAMVGGRGVASISLGTFNLQVPHWSTKKQVTHSLSGEIKGERLVGLHHLPSSPGASVVVTKPPNKYGVYDAIVTVNHNGVSYTKPSTMFPDKWSQERIMSEVNYAWKNAKHTKGNTFEGTTNTGFKIRFYENSLDGSYNFHPLY